MNTQDYHLRQALEAAKNQRMVQAEAFVSDAIRCDAGRADAWGLKGLIEYGRGEIEMAIRSWSRCLNSQESELHPAVKRWLEEIKKDIPNFNRARVLYNQALELVQANGDCEEAVKLLTEACKINSGLIEAWKLLGLICVKQNNLEQAMRHWAKALKINAQDQEVLQMITAFIRPEIEKVIPPPKKRLRLFLLAGLFGMLILAVLGWGVLRYRAFYLHDRKKLEAQQVLTARLEAEIGRLSEAAAQNDLMKTDRERLIESLEEIQINHEREIKKLNEQNYFLRKERKQMQAEVDRLKKTADGLTL